MNCSCLSLFMLPEDGQTLHYAFKKLKIHFFSITSVNCATSYWNYIFLTAFRGFLYRFFHLTIFRFLSRTAVSGETLTSTSELYTELHTVDDSVEDKWCCLQWLLSRRTDPSVALEHRQLNLQSSNTQVPLDKSKQAYIFPMQPQEPFSSLDTVFLPALMSNTNRSGQCCWKLHCLISFFIPCNVNINIGFR